MPSAAAGTMTSRPARASERATASATAPAPMTTQSALSVTTPFTTRPIALLAVEKKLASCRRRCLNSRRRHRETYNQIGNFMKDDTILTHAGRDPFSHHGIANPPVYHASTVLFPTWDSLLHRRKGQTTHVAYGHRDTH